MSRSTTDTSVFIVRITIMPARKLLSSKPKQILTPAMNSPEASLNGIRALARELLLEAQALNSDRAAVYSVPQEDIDTLISQLAISFKEIAKQRREIERLKKRTRSVVEKLKGTQI